MLKMLNKLVSMLLVISIMMCELGLLKGEEALLIADGSTNTIIDVTSNGTPMVNIANPNEKGLSHNRYSDFNVNEKNLVMNNSKEAYGVSQIGGAVVGNPTLINSGREANIILNEVTSNRRSNVGGYIEVYGKKADFILANPNGIQIAGGGFINTSDVKLVTGVPRLENGEIKDYSLSEQGMITINGRDASSIVGLGLDLSQVDKATLVSRILEIRGKIYAKELNILAGNDIYDNLTGEVSSVDKANPNGITIAVDSSLLGGMYAGRIKIICNERGFGVNTQGDLVADVNDIEIKSDGKIEVIRGKSKGKIYMNGRGGVKVKEKLEAEGKIDLNSENKIDIKEAVSLGAMEVTGGSLENNESSFVSGGEIVITTTGDMIYGKIEGNKSISLTSGGNLTSSVLLKAVENLKLAVVGATNISEILSGGSLEIIAGSIERSDSKITSIGDVNIKSTTGALNYGTLETNGNASLESIGELTTIGKTTVLGELTMTGDSINFIELMSGGKMKLSWVSNILNLGKAESYGDMELTGESLGLSSGKKLLSHGNMSWTGESLSNAGELISGLNMELIGSEKVENKGNIQSLGEIKINGDKKVENASTGLIYGKGNIELNSKENIKNDGEIQGIDSIKLESDGNVENNKNIKANGKLEIISGSLSNSGSSEIASGSELNVKVKSRYDNYGKLLGNSLILGVLGIFNNLGELESEGDMSFNVVGFNNETAGDIKIGGKLGIENSWIFLNKGEIKSVGDMIIKGSDFGISGLLLSGGKIDLGVLGSLENTGEISSYGEMKIDVGSNVVNRGYIMTNSSLDIKSANLYNSESGYIYSKLKSLYRTGGLLENYRGVMYSDGEMEFRGINAGERSAIIRNTGGQLLSKGAMIFRGNSIENLSIDNYSSFDQAGAYGLTETFLGGDGGSWQQGHDMNSHENQVDYQAYSNMSAIAQGLMRGYSIYMEGGDITNRSSKMYADTNINVIANNFYNTRMSGKVAYQSYSGERYHEGGWETDVYNASYDDWVVRIGDKRIFSYIKAANGNYIAIKKEDGCWYRIYTDGHEEKKRPDKKDYEYREDTLYNNTPSEVKAGGYVYIQANKVGVDVPTIAQYSGLPVNITYGGVNKELDEIKNSGKVEMIGDLVVGGIDKIGNINLGEVSIPGYKINNPDSQYLIETRNRFFEAGDFIGSKYYMDRLGYTTDTYKDLKFLGDAVYEQKLVEDMIMKATGNHYLNTGILDTNQQMMELYENAIAENKRLGFEVGSYLTEEQTKSLEKDILWYVSKFVNNSLVLVPVLYLSKSTKERIDNGTMSIISANTVNLEVGTIENRGKITGDKVQIVAEKDILNIDGKITATESLGLKAGNNLLNSSSVNKVSIDGGWTETLAGLGQISSLGTLSLDIGNLLKVEGAEINSLGNAIIKAKDMELTTLELSGKKHSIDGNTSILETWTNNYGSSLNVGSNLALDITNNATIKGSEVNVGGSADLKVGGDLTLESAEDTYTKESITKTSSKKMSGSKKSETKETIKTTTNQGSSLNVGGNLKTDIGKDMTLKGSEVNVGGSADIKVGGDLEVLSVEDIYEKTTEKSSSKKNIGGSEKVKEKERLKQTKNQGSSINVGGDLGVEAGGEVYLLGSELNSGGNTDITAERFTSEAAVDREEYSYEKTVEKTSLNLASIAAVIAPLTPIGGIVQVVGGMFGTVGTMASTTVLNATQASGFDYKDGKLSMEIASVSKTKEYRGHTTETASESKVKSGGTLTINTKKELLNIGSSLESEGKMTLSSDEGNVFLLSKELKQTSYEGEKKMEGSLSIGVGNAYVDTGYAAKAVVDAGKVVEEANKKLREIKNKEKAGKASSNAVKDAELNLALASANLAQATASLATSIASSAAAAGSSMGTGFYGDVTLAMSGHENRTDISETTNHGSSIKSGSDINMTSKVGSISQVGSSVEAKGNIVYDAKEKIGIVSSVDTYLETNKSKDISASVSYGTNGFNASASYGESQGRTMATTNNNSRVEAGGNITLKAGEEVKISGGNVKGETVEVDTKNLIVESKQDTYYSNSSGINLGAGLGSSSVSGSFATNSSSRDMEWVNNQSSIISNGKLDIKATNETTLKGGVIGSETGQMVLETGKLTTEDIKDKDYSDASGFSVGTTIGSSSNGKDKNKFPSGSTNLSMQNEGSEKEQTTKATIGAGKIIVAGEDVSVIPAEAGILSGVNRDLNNTQITTKDEITGALNANLTIDNRMFTEEGRESIANDYKNMKENLYTISENMPVPMLENTVKVIAETVGAGQNLVGDVVGVFSKDGSDVSKIVKDVKMTSQTGVGLGQSYLSGDIFYSQDEANLGGDGEVQLLTANGILTGEKGAKDNLNAVIEVAKEKGETREIKGTKITNNTSYVGDLIQSIGYAFGVKDIVAINTANTIKELADNGVVNVVSHSQGEAGTSLGLDILKYNGYENMGNIYSKGFGGQKIITQEKYGLGGAENYADSRDIVPKIENIITGGIRNKTSDINYVNNYAGMNHGFAERDKTTGKIINGYVKEINNLK